VGIILGLCLLLSGVLFFLCNISGDNPGDVFLGGGGS
jgi:hypothetical protein